MTLLLIFGFIYLFNLLPAFTPPTWMVLSYLQVVYHPHFLILAPLGALAATLGRLSLAKLAKIIVRDRFLSAKTIRNIDAIQNKLREHKRLTFSVFLIYAFGPFPSNQLFLAYGLTDMELKLIGLPFFLGRLVSYTFWIVLASEVAHRLAAKSLVQKSFFKWYFIASQLLTLAAVYIFTKIDWRKLLTEKKLGWIR